MLLAFLIIYAISFPSIASEVRELIALPSGKYEVCTTALLAKRRASSALSPSLQSKHTKIEEDTLLSSPTALTLSVPITPGSLPPLQTPNTPMENLSVTKSLPEKKSLDQTTILITQSSERHSKNRSPSGLQASKRHPKKNNLIKRQAIPRAPSCLIVSLPMQHSTVTVGSIPPTTNEESPDQTKSLTPPNPQTHRTQNTLGELQHSTVTVCSTPLTTDEESPDQTKSLTPPNPQTHRTQNTLGELQHSTVTVCSTPLTTDEESPDQTKSLTPPNPQTHRTQNTLGELSPSEPRSGRPYNSLAQGIYRCLTQSTKDSTHFLQYYDEFFNGSFKSIKPHITSLHDSSLDAREQNIRLALQYASSLSSQDALRPYFMSFLQVWLFLTSPHCPTQNTLNILENAYQQKSRSHQHFPQLFKVGYIIQEIQDEKLSCPYDLSDLATTIRNLHKKKPLLKDLLHTFAQYSSLTDDLISLLTTAPRLSALESCFVKANRQISPKTTAPTTSNQILPQSIRALTVLNICRELIAKPSVFCTLLESLVEGNPQIAHTEVSTDLIKEQTTPEHKRLLKLFTYIEDLEISNQFRISCISLIQAGLCIHSPYAPKPSTLYLLDFNYSDCGRNTPQYYSQIFKIAYAIQYIVSEGLEYMIDKVKVDFSNMAEAIPLLKSTFSTTKELLFSLSSFTQSSTKIHNPLFAPICFLSNLKAIVPKPLCCTPENCAKSTLGQDLHAPHNGPDPLEGMVSPVTPSILPLVDTHAGSITSHSSPHAEQTHALLVNVTTNATANSQEPESMPCASVTSYWAQQDELSVPQPPANAIHLTFSQTIEALQTQLPPLEKAALIFNAADAISAFAYESQGLLASAMYWQQHCAPQESQIEYEDTISASSTTEMHPNPTEVDAIPSLVPSVDPENTNTSRPLEPESPGNLSLSRAGEDVRGKKTALILNAVHAILKNPKQKTQEVQALYETLYNCSPPSLLSVALSHMQDDANKSHQPGMRGLVDLCTFLSAKPAFDLHLLQVVMEQYPEEANACTSKTKESNNLRILMRLTYNLQHLFGTAKSYPSDLQKLTKALKDCGLCTRDANTAFSGSYHLLLDRLSRKQAEYTDSMGLCMPKVHFTQLIEIIKKAEKDTHQEVEAPQKYQSESDDSSSDEDFFPHEVSHHKGADCSPLIVRYPKSKKSRPTSSYVVSAPKLESRYEQMTKDPEISCQILSETYQNLYKGFPSHEESLPSIALKVFERFPRSDTRKHRCMIGMMELCVFHLSSKFDTKLFAKLSKIYSIPKIEQSSEATNPTRSVVKLTYLLQTLIKNLTQPAGNTHDTLRILRIPTNSISKALEEAFALVQGKKHPNLSFLIEKSIATELCQPNVKCSQIVRHLHHLVKHNV